MSTRGQIFYHRSILDTELQPLALCATDDGSDPMALLVDLSPGMLNDLAASVKRCEELAQWARDGGERCLVIRPGQRGPGTVAQGPGEVDVLEAIDWACRNFPVDPDRISLLGVSMGGAGAWYLASHYPDRFAATASFSGYCDHTLWVKPGGTILRNQSWEEFSWLGRDAACQVGNLSNMALWITHGEWDIGIGGGVPVQHSRAMSARLRELGIEHIYNELPETGHDTMRFKDGPQVIQWLCRQRRKVCPERVRLRAFTLRHTRLFWVRIAQFEQYGLPAHVDAHADASGVTVSTGNVRRLAIGPIPGLRETTLTVDGTVLTAPGVAEKPVFCTKADAKWEISGPTAGGEKHPGASGPIGDIFLAPQRFVFPGACGPRETLYFDWMPRNLRTYFKANNGGVHRGIFAGNSTYNLPTACDKELSEEDITQNNLVVYGLFDSNALLRRFRDCLPVDIGANGIEIAGRAFEGTDLGFMGTFPHPLNADRVMVVASGNSLDGMVGCTHLNLQLLPDYIVWRGTETWWGFLDNAWRMT